MFSFGAEPAPEAVAFDSTTSTVFVEELDDMVKHAEAFEELRSAALTPTQTLSFLGDQLAKLPESESDAE